MNILGIPGTKGFPFLKISTHPHSAKILNKPVINVSFKEESKENALICKFTYSADNGPIGEIDGEGHGESTKDK